ncbi:MAG: hypothetical protein JW818_05140 [Pirellulales bacterium]|nr:hypothetical protein [Pirellulales bacterium]
MLAAVLLCLAAFSGPGPSNPATQAGDTATVPTNSPDVLPEGAPPAKTRLREGMKLVDQLGHFRATGDRIAFFTHNDTTRLIGLENLNLQRVATAIAEQPKGRLWKVTGTITEYRGENFLLVDRAILESWEKSQTKTP